MLNTFESLDWYLAIPRVQGLVATPDGSRVVASFSRLDHDKTGYVSSLWELDPDGATPARRLTRGLKGEAEAVFTSAGELLFTAHRPGSTIEATADQAPDDSPAPLWLLPTSGEARQVAQATGGLRALKVASAAGAVLAATDVLPSATPRGDGDLRKARKDAGVTAVLHENYPVRFWDHDLGPARTRLVTFDIADTTDETVDIVRIVPTEFAGGLDDETDWGITPDGRTIVTGWVAPTATASLRYSIEVIDVESGTRSTLLADRDNEYLFCDLSPDGASALVKRMTVSTPTESPVTHLLLVRLSDGQVRVLTPDFDEQPEEARFSDDGSAVVFVADENGRRPLYEVSTDGTRPVRKLAGDACFTCPVPTARGIFALRNSYLEPNRPVRVDWDGSVHELPSPAPEIKLPGTLTEIEATGLDGARVRAWLALPTGASESDPAPLLLWIHGGPVHSWSQWSWRWCPWLMVARGYAVLLPDPALSTGYGREFVQRGWGRWGDAPYTDLMAITDSAEALPAIDQTRTAALGGSFGGYMANWIAGHTDRFDCIVTHASLWDLPGFSATTDLAFFWQREMSPEMTERNSPQRSVAAINTPMLVIHGDRDYRVPIAEGLRLWFELLAKDTDEDGRSPHKFLYFPDENHWILRPGNVKVWYETVLAFLAQHVLGEQWRRPELLG